MNKNLWLGIALLVSLAVNLLIGGAVLGRLAGQRPPASAAPPPMDWAVRDLRPELRDRLRPQLQAHLADVQPLRRDMRLALRDFGLALRSQEMDTAAAREALGRLRSASAEYQRILHDNMLLILAQLEPAEREAAARAAMRQMMQRDDRSPMGQRRPPAGGGERPPGAARDG